MPYFFLKDTVFGHPKRVWLSSSYRYNAVMTSFDHEVLAMIADNLRTS